MIITAKYIRENFNPSECVIRNFEKKYPDFKGSLVDILCLDNISYGNKVWLACKLVDIKDLQQWSVECAEYVLDIYESTYTRDSRVGHCIETTKKYLVEETTIEDLNAAASYAAWEAASYCDSHAARDAVRAAARYAANYAASSASRDAARDAASESEQEDINLSILIAIISNGNY